MKSIVDEIKNEFLKGCELKNIARKSTKKPDLYREAAKHFEKAALLSAKTAEDGSDSLDGRIQSKVFSHYYSYAANNCLGIYYHEKWETDTAKPYHKKSLKEISRALELLREFFPRVFSETKDHFNELLPTWKYDQDFCTVQLLASDARAAWDKGSFIEAADLYKKIRDHSHKIIEFVRSEKLDPLYERVAVSNYLGAIINDKNTYGRIILSKQVREDGSLAPLVPKVYIVEWIRSALDASQLSHQAFRNNPEWEQHFEIARVYIRIIQNYFKNNKSFWLRFYIEFENEPEILKFMKTIDLELFEEIEAKRYSLKNANEYGTPNRDSKSSEDYTPIFPSLEDLRWQEVKIIFISEFEIKIIARNQSRKFSFNQIGFKDKRRDNKPNTRWYFLKEFAIYNGKSDWHEQLMQCEKVRVRAIIKDLRIYLKRIVGINDDPFYPFHEDKAYKTKFKLEDNSVSDQSSD